MHRIPVALVVALLAVSPFAFADPIRFSGSLRARAENWAFFESPGSEDAYTFGGALLRASAAAQLNSNVDWQVELAAPLLVGLPDGAVAPAPRGQLGFGGSYYAGSGGDENAASLFAKQAFVRFRSGTHAFRLGRFEFGDGAEVAPKNAMLAPLKASRVSQRLIGPFGFTHVGRSFDGVQYVNDRPGLNVTAALVRPTVGAFDVSGLDEISGVRLGYGAITFSRPNADHRIFVIRYRDRRSGLVKTDNRPAPVRAADREDVEVITVGGHVLAAFGNVDVVLWGALQGGQWGAVDHSASAVDVEAGYHLAGAMKPVVRAGFFRSSGDGDPLDGDHETFFQILPTPRVYARFPFYNAMNSTDAFLQFSIKPTARLTLTSEAHLLSLTERADLWYAGGGSFERESFGYAGRPSNGREELARVVDVGLDFAVNPRTSVTVYLGMASGGEVVEAIFAGDDARYFYLEATRRF